MGLNRGTDRDAEMEKRKIGEPSSSGNHPGMSPHGLGQAGCGAALFS